MKEDESPHSVLRKASNFRLKMKNSLKVNLKNQIFE